MVREQSAGLTTVAEKALCQLTEMSARAQTLDVEVKLLRPQMNVVAETRDGAISSGNGKGQEAKMLEYCIALLKDELDYLKQKEATGCNLKIVGGNATDAKGERKSLVDGLRRDTFDLYASI